MKANKIVTLAAAGALLLGAQGAWAAAAAATGCKAVLNVAANATSLQQEAIVTKIKTVTTGSSAHATTGITSTAFKNPMWVTLMSNDGTVCMVYTDAKTGVTNTDGTGIGANGWLLSRVISAQKANTANGLGMPTGALYSLVQPGTGSLYGLQHSNPVDPAFAYKGTDKTFGDTKKDPMIGKRVGGVNVFAGGLPLYSGSNKIGAIGVSGDTSCEDQSVAFNIRAALGSAGLAPSATDAISLGSSDHPDCGAAALSGKAGWAP